MPPGEASKPLPALLDAGDVSSHTTVVNSTRVLKPYFCSIYQPKPRGFAPNRNREWPSVCSGQDLLSQLCFRAIQPHSQCRLQLLLPF
jgi:hypothetical protein